MTTRKTVKKIKRKEEMFIVIANDGCFFDNDDDFNDGLGDYIFSLELDAISVAKDGIKNSDDDEHIEATVYKLVAVAKVKPAAVRPVAVVVEKL